MAEFVKKLEDAPQGAVIGISNSIQQLSVGQSMIIGIRGASGTNGGLALSIGPSDPASACMVEQDSESSTSIRWFRLTGIKETKLVCEARHPKNQTLWDFFQLAIVQNGSPPPKPEPTGPIDSETRLLAAISYGEASKMNLFGEMAAIANVLVRQKHARGMKTIKTLVASDRNLAYAASDKSKRYAGLRKASEETINKNPAMSMAVRAARNALSPSGTDYSNGAYFWDGKDIKTNFAHHDKVQQGIKFSDPAHNIYGLSKEQVEGTWKLRKGFYEYYNKKTKKKVMTERGSYDHVYVSTAAWGGTIFWKINPDFIKATGGTEYR